MDWINCNSCCRQPGDEKERTFVLTSCGHIFCDICLSQSENREKCASCSTRCQLIQLSSKMKPDAEMFFLEPGELLKRHYTQINRLLEFQKEHRIRLVSFHRRIIQKYKDLEKQYKSTCGNLQETEKKFIAASKHIHDLEGENRKLREMISSQGGTTAGSTPNTYTSPHTSYQRAITSQRNSPQVSPGGTRISPGRLTLMKPAPGYSGTSRSPTHQHPTSLAAYHQSNRIGASPQPYHSLGHPHSQNQLVPSTGMIQTPTGSGMNYLRSSNSAHSRTPSPTRGMLNSMGRLTPMSQGQHFHPNAGVKSNLQGPHLGQTGLHLPHGAADQRIVQHRLGPPCTVESPIQGGSGLTLYRYPH